MGEQGETQYRKPIICLDFDGVIHSYTSGWKGADVIPDPPVPGALAFILDAKQDFAVAIYSSRSGQSGGIEAMKRWMKHWMSEHAVLGSKLGPANAHVIIESLSWPTEKPPAMVTIDDRAMTFTGTWPTLQQIRDFRPWNKS